MSTFNKTKAKQVRQKLLKMLDESYKNDCKQNCRDCVLISKIKAGKGTQCTLDILRLCLIGEI